ncbi:MAG TPA: cytochrome c [Desulfobacteria bacterium]|nr:cytochrome c [Desulfobacteria bacterium]
MRARSFVILSMCAIGAFVILNWLAVKPYGRISDAATAGKMVWQAHNCISCHTLLGNGGYRGGDLSHVIIKGRAAVVGYLINPPVMLPNRIRRHPAVQEEEAERLADYLTFIDTIPTLGWPPEKSAGKP